MERVFVASPTIYLQLSGIYGFASQILSHTAVGAAVLGLQGVYTQVTGASVELHHHEAIHSCLNRLPVQGPMNTQGQVTLQDHTGNAQDITHVEDFAAKAKGQDMWRHCRIK